MVQSADRNWDVPEVLFTGDTYNANADFSRLKYGDGIKDEPAILSDVFHYRLEAAAPGRWGGVWVAGREQTLVGTDNSQTNVANVKQFDTWVGLWSART